MAEQKLIATGECRLGTGDMFELSTKAEAARNICNQAATEIQKTFPDFRFSFTTGNWRDPSKPAPGRKSAEQKAADAAAKAAAEAAATGKSNGADKGADKAADKTGVTATA